MKLNKRINVRVNRRENQDLTIKRYW